MKTIDERREELENLAEKLGENSQFDIEKVWEKDEVAIYRKTFKRGEDYESHVYTSTVHWTDDACSVIRQMKYKGEWNVAISYGSGGTLTSKPRLVAMAMEQIFRLARRSVFQLSKVEE